MWHCHILDVVNYCHDMMLLCGHVVGHNPDGALDFVGKQKRDETTLAALKEHFESYDEEVWNYSPNETGTNENVDNMKTKSKTISNEGDNRMSIRIRDQNGEETMFTVKRTTKMEKVFNAFAGRKGVDVQVLRFLLHGEPLYPGDRDTPESLELEDGDQIDCMLQQLAC